MKAKLISMLFVSCLVSFTNNTVAQKVKIERVTDTLSKPGAYFALPATVISVEVEIMKISMDTGQFLLYASLIKSFYNGKIIDKKSETISIGTNHVISVRSTPDKNYLYWVDFKKRPFKNQDFSFALNESNVVEGANVAIKDKTFDIVTKGLSSIASIVGSFARGADGVSPLPDSILVDKKKIFVPQNVKDAVIHIEGLIKRRTDLITAPRFGAEVDTFNKMLEELDKQIKSELAKFIGTKSTTTYTYKYDYLVADQMGSVDITIPLLSVTTAGTSSSVTYNAPLSYYVNTGIIAKGESPNATVELRIIEQDSPLNNLVMEPSDKTKKGLPYRIPGKAAVQILVKKEVKAASLFPIAQFGTVSYLPYKMNEVNIQYFEDLGAIKSITAKNTAITPEEIDALKSNTQGFIDQLKGDDELTRVQKENELLEAKKTNAQLKEELLPKTDN